MKRIGIILNIILMMILPAPLLMAGNFTSRTATVKVIPYHKEENGDEGIRIPPRAIQCNISIENGIEPIDTSDIHTFEVWNREDVAMVASFGAESEFVDFVLSYTSPCIIKLNSEDYTYIGYLE